MGADAGAIRSMAFALTPQALQESAADVTATPTPRVILIRPTSTPRLSGNRNGPAQQGRAADGDTTGHHH